MKGGLLDTALILLIFLAAWAGVNLPVLGSPLGRYPVVDWEPWQSMGMHRFTVENFLLFYLIDQSTRTVTLVRIVYGGRNLQNLAK